MFLPPRRVGEPFILNFWVMAEVDEQTELEIGCAKVVQDLRPMLVGEYRNGFDFHDDLLVAYKIRLINLSESSSSVIQ